MRFYRSLLTSLQVFVQGDEEEAGVAAPPVVYYYYSVFRLSLSHCLPFE